MDVESPHLLLYSQIDDSGRWRFVLRGSDGVPHFEAHDTEAQVPSERLELLTVVRALESLDQPSRVTLVDCSDYVLSGVRYGLLEWRGNDWRWEYFGQMVPVKNSDLWQRLDRALQFHDVQCRRRRFDGPHKARVHNAPHRANSNRGVRNKLADWLKYATWAVPRGVRLCCRAAGHRFLHGRRLEVKQTSA
jgi:ribonuclease HI